MWHVELVHSTGAALLHIVRLSGSDAGWQNNLIKHIHRQLST